MRSEDKWIWGLLLASLLIVLSTDFFFIKIPAVSFYIYQLGRTPNNLSLAYISSVIFYWIVVSIPDNRKKKHIYKYVYERTGNVIGDCTALLRDLIKTSGYIPANKNLTEADFKSILGKIHPYSEAPLLNGFTADGKHKYANWVEYMYYQKLRSFDFIDKIFERIIFLESESEYIKLLTEVKDQLYFLQVQTFMLHTGTTLQMTNTDLSFFAPTMHKYYESLKNLKKYSDSNFAKYSEGFSLNGMEDFN
jgi:hypothetical protein